MNSQLFSNNAVSLLAAPLSHSGLVIELTAGFGALFPSPTNGDWFLVTLEDQQATHREIIKIIGRTADTLIVDPNGRGWENSQSRAWTTNPPTLVDQRITAGTLRELSNAYSNHDFASLKTFKEALDYLLPLSASTPIGSNNRIYNAQIVLETPNAGKTLIDLPSAYVTNSTAVYVGGLRQKLGIDYVEIESTKLILNYELTIDDLLEGQSLTVDYNPIS